MQTLLSNYALKQSPHTSWLPLAYLVGFLSILLLSFWAESHRQQRLSNEPPIKYCQCLDHRLTQATIDGGGTSPPT